MQGTVTPVRAPFLNQNLAEAFRFSAFPFFTLVLNFLQLQFFSQKASAEERGSRGHPLIDATNAT